MTRFGDLALGAALGAMAMTALVAVAADALSMDPVKISPQYYSVRLDNERVREWHLKPGEKEKMHSHPDGIVIVLADATLKGTSPAGISTTTALVNGDVRWRAALSTSLENVGSTEAHALAIELKSGGK